MDYEASERSRSIEELLEWALIDAGERRWRHIAELHRRGGREVFEAAIDLCRDKRPRRRALGADILGQLGLDDRPFLDERLEELVALMEGEEDLDVVESIATALGHLRDERALTPLLRLSTHAHPDVRWAVAIGLPACLGPDGERDPRLVSTLIELTKDPDSDVRDWATFGIGSQLEDDTPEVRDALLARVVDEHYDTRCEALAALARRGDDRVIEPIIAELGRQDVGRLVVEAALAAADTRLFDALVALQDHWDDDEGLLAQAIKRCRPHEAQPADDA